MMIQSNPNRVTSVRVIGLIPMQIGKEIRGSETSQYPGEKKSYEIP